ncbi:damage-inducible protein DinB [Sulfitobacter sp. EhC04]|uniref:DinB family protein n=1 Tax=Sulfitobacter sp. EhC04 TaxID=1849168 RepID=UPI0007F39C8D|nr:DinB family protein [Sulfitobacter sp. EhC04]OAN71429.1 damage-inducible protein DinB [Sulfitobacter sp. EhC04]
MIDAGFVQIMARYNAWQNRQIMEIVKDMDDAALDHDHGAFFGTIRGTLNHLLWGDTMWMSRFCDDVAKPKVGGDQSTTCTETIGVWQAERFRMDGRIRIWSETLSNIDLLGDLTWYSGLTKSEMSKPRALCIVHLFNHQTHHRGQVHAMLTAGGHAAPVSDLAFMPEDA